MVMVCRDRKAARAGLWRKEVAIYADKEGADKWKERTGGENRQDERTQ
jgi:hypothetical protein